MLYFYHCFLSLLLGKRLIKCFIIIYKWQHFAGMCFGGFFFWLRSFYQILCYPLVFVMLHSFKNQIFVFFLSSEIHSELLDPAYFYILVKFPYKIIWDYHKFFLFHFSSIDIGQIRLSTLTTVVLLNYIFHKQSLAFRFSNSL